MFGSLGRGLLAALCVGIATQAYGAGIGPMNLHHDAVDELGYPWSAIGKLFNEAGVQCSGVAIARDRVLTAAHCLFNERSRRFATAGSLHFMVAYRAGRKALEARVDHYDIAPGFDPLRYQDTTGADWAVLTLTENLPEEIVPLRLSRGSEPSGTQVMMAGYPQDRAFAMTADRDCRLGNSVASGRLLLHTCRGMKGYSGAPILTVGDDRKIEVAAIQIAAIHGDPTRMMFAVPAKAILQSVSMNAPRDTVCLSHGFRGEFNLGDIQVRLDVDKLNLSADVDQVLEAARADVAMQFASAPVTVATR